MRQVFSSLKVGHREVRIRRSENPKPTPRPAAKNMFRPQKSQPTAPIRLSKMHGVPVYEDVFHCLQEAQKNLGRAVELPWIAENPSRDCALAVNCDKDGGDPQWTFIIGDGAFREVRWNYQSGDIGLITNLLTRECLGDDTDMNAKQLEAFGGMKATASNIKAVSAEPESEARRSRPAFTESQEIERHATLEGDLLNMTVANVLQSIVISKMTGMLSVAQVDEGIDVFFENGQPLHAASSECKGEAAIMEVLTWDKGKFSFFPNDRSSERTVTKRIDALIAEAAPLVDQYRVINQSGVTMSSYFVRKHPKLTEADFEQRMAAGARLDMSEQKEFYQLIDNQSTLFELLRKMPFNKVEWIPLVYNLIVSDLIAVTEKPTQVRTQQPIEAMGVDRSAIDAGMKNMMRQETGLINYPVILYFLEQEFFRWEHTGAPFCLLIFEMRVRTPVGLEPLPLPMIKEAARRIGTIKRNIDVLAHFETFGFLVMLPYTNVQAATMVAKRITEVLWDEKIGGEIDSRNLAIAFGVTGIPEDCTDLGMMLSTAKEAMMSSKATGSPVVAFKASQTQ